MYYIQIVVICSHFSIFGTLETTNRIKTIGVNCCDLLSFPYLWNIGNNNHSHKTIADSVVICSHFSIFGTLETTPNL